MIRAATAVVALFLSLPLAAAPKHRAVRTPGGDGVAAWLAANAHALTSVELPASSGDLEPLRTMIGPSTLVGLGDDTHGTHEFYTVKLRVIDFLVREMGFDVVAFEAPFPLFNKINAYVQGEPGDVRAFLDQARLLGYGFWNVEEMLAIVEWMHDYNAHRGERPAVSIAGIDTYDQKNAAQEVVAFLAALDLAASAAAQQDYQCVYDGAPTGDAACHTSTQRVYDALAARETELVPLTPPHAYDEALQNARVVRQYYDNGAFSEGRDQAMADNTLWLREHRGTSRHLLVWAHQEHAAKSRMHALRQRSMGSMIRSSIGDDYFVIGTSTRQGSFQTWLPNSGGLPDQVVTIPAPPEGAYETYFQKGGAPYLLIPLRGVVPSWLQGPAAFFTAPANVTSHISISPILPEKLDAVIYIDTTGPTHPLTQ